MGRLRRGIELFKLSWSVIMKEKSLLVFPVLSGLFSIMIAVTFFLPLLVIFGEELMFSEWLTWIVVFVFYLIAYFITIFFNVALMSNAMTVMEGKNPTLMDGLGFAAGRVRYIFYWAMFSATVGLVLQVIRSKGGVIGQVASGLLGVAWSIATFFVIPVMAFEQIGPLQAIRKSLSLFKATWGETIVSSLGIGIIFFLMALAGLVPLIIIAVYGSLLMIVVTLVAVIVYWILLAVIASAMNQVLIAALYRFATTGKTYLDVDKSFSGLMHRN